MHSKNGLRWRWDGFVSYPPVRVSCLLLLPVL